MASNYDVGTKAWQTDQTEGWVASEVTQKVVDGDAVRLVFALENGEVGTNLWCRVRILTEETFRPGQSIRRLRHCPKTP